MRSFLYLLLVLMNSGNSRGSGSLFEWHGFSVSESKLNQMGQRKVSLAFETDMALAVRCRSQSSIVNDILFELALDRCGAYLNWLSKLKSGPHGLAFARQCKDDLRLKIAESERPKPNSMR